MRVVSWPPEGVGSAETLPEEIFRRAKKKSHHKDPQKKTKLYPVYFSTGNPFMTSRSLRNDAIAPKDLLEVTSSPHVGSDTIPSSPSPNAARIRPFEAKKFINPIC